MRSLTGISSAGLVARSFCWTNDLGPILTVTGANGGATPPVLPTVSQSVNPHPGGWPCADASSTTDGRGKGTRKFCLEFL